MAGFGILLTTLAALLGAVRLVVAWSSPMLRRRGQRYSSHDGTGPSTDTASPGDGGGHHGWSGDHAGDGGGHGGDGGSGDGGH